MELITRPQFYLDIAEEVEYLAQKAGPETAERWHAALERTISATASASLSWQAKARLGTFWNSLVARE